MSSKLIKRGITLDPELLKKVQSKVPADLNLSISQIVALTFTTYLKHVEGYEQKQMNEGKLTDV